MDCLPEVGWKETTLSEVGNEVGNEVGEVGKVGEVGGEVVEMGWKETEI